MGRSQGDSGSGCVTSLLISASYLVVGILVIPIVAAVVLPSVLNHTELYPILLPLAIIYSIGVYAGGTALAAGMYYDRLPKIMEVVTRE
ncbi:MAG: hypothetical protein H0X24_10930 [Ktedonobacterales bacterium]|nr:hypothetical protein [Ktedonobacterales bacterium]